MEMTHKNGGDKAAMTSRNRRDLDGDTDDVDGGWAWVVLVASFVVNAISLGSNFAFGIFLGEWLDAFGAGSTATSLLISTSCALVLGSGPFASILANRYGARIVIVIGGVLTAAGFAFSAFVSNFWALFFTFSIMTGLGNGLAYSPSFGVLPLYFRKRRNFATSIVTAGNGVGIVIFSALFRYLITAYGWRGAMLITAGVVLNIVPCGAVIFKRQPRRASGTFKDLAEVSLFSEAAFYASLLHSACMGSQYIFVVFCVQYARQNTHVSVEDAAFVVTSMGVTNIVGRTLVAFVSTAPKLATTHKRFCYLHVMSLAVAVAIALYPTTRDTYSLTGLCTMSALVGLSWGTKFSLVPGLQMDILGPQRFNAAWGYIAFVLGWAFFAFPPIASEIGKATNWDNAFYFAGGMSFLAFLCCPVLHFLWWRNSKRDNLHSSTEIPREKSSSLDA